MFCSSSEFNEEVRRVNSKMSVDNGYLRHVRFDLDRWTREATKVLSPLLRSHIRRPNTMVVRRHPRIKQTPAYCCYCQSPWFPLAKPTGTAAEVWSLARFREYRDHNDADGIVCLTALKGEPPAEQCLSALLGRCLRVRLVGREACKTAGAGRLRR